MTYGTTKATPPFSWPARTAITPASVCWSRFVVERVNRCVYFRGGRSHIFTLLSCSKILESGLGSNIFSRLRIRLPSMQPKLSNVCTEAMACIKTTQAPATDENEMWLRIGVLIFTDFLLRVLKNARSCQSRLRVRGHSGLFDNKEQIAESNTAFM